MFMIYAHATEKTKLQVSSRATPANLKMARNTRIAKQQRPLNTRIMCIVYSHPEKYENARAQSQTWGARCDGFVVMSTVEDESISAIHLTHAGVQIYVCMDRWMYIYMHTHTHRQAERNTLHIHIHIHIHIHTHVHMHMAM